MTETILRRSIIVGAFLVLLVPFIVVYSSFFPYVVGKAVLFRTIVGLMLGAWASLAFINPAYRPRWSPVMISTAIFLGVVCVADLLGVNAVRSFWSNFERMEGFVTIAHVVAYLFVVGSVMRSEKLWDWFWNVSIVGSVLASLMAFGEAAKIPEGQLIRVDATLGNPTYLAVYLLINIFVVLFMAYRARTNKLRLLGYVVAIIVQIVGLYYTGTRGAFLGLVAGIGVAALIVLLRGKEHPRMRRTAGVIAGLVLVGMGAFFMLRNTAFFQENPTLARIANISLTDTTVESRITLWTSIGWNAFLERPILGWGQDNFIVAFGKYYDPLMYGQEPWFDRAHNVFVDWLVAAGVVGVIAYLGLFGASLWVLWNGGLTFPEKAILTGLLGAYVCNNIFVFDNLTSYMYFALFLAYVHVRASSSDDDTPKRAESSERDVFVVLGFGIVAVALIWFSAIRPMARSMTLIDALRIDYNSHDQVGALAFYEKVLAYGNITGLEETREQLSQTALRALDNPQIDDAGRNAVVGRALTELVDSATAEPNNTRRLYFLAHTLKSANRPDDARVVFDQALALNPTRQNFLYEVAQIYLAEGDFQKAIDTFKTAYDAQTENDTAFQYYAGALMLSGKTREAEDLLVGRFGTTTVDNDLVFRAYETAGRKDKLADILELRLRNAGPEDNPGMRVSLALVYLDLGRRDDAIVQIQKAATIRPDFAEQADQMIAAIKAGKKIKIK